jgi:hypothetical protein
MHDVQWKSTATNDLAAICLEHPTMWVVINAAELDIANKLRRDPVQFSQEVSEGLQRSSPGL